jgi:betaine-aldehyde dehydrogenase
VCVGIGAWNYPLQIACWKAAPALMMGNTMIFKPSELTPMTALKLAEIFIEAGMPAGVFNVVLGDGETAAMLLADNRIAKVSFTGSVPTGKKILAQAAQQVLPVTLELGGKSPLVIFEDAELDEAVSGAMLANFYTQGEICSNGTRVFVARRLHEAFIEQLAARTEKLVVGNPFDTRTQIGALISPAHLQKVLGYIDAGKSEGATLVTGGQTLRDPQLIQGNFITPAIFTNCRDEMSIMRDEIFGPVMSVTVFDDEEEVIHRANDTHYGLAAGVFTADIKRGHRVAKYLEAGVCWVNNYNVTPVGMPFGGIKHSGFGRENTKEALRSYTRQKSIYVELDKVEHCYE